MPKRRRPKMKKFKCTYKPMCESQYWNGFPMDKLIAAYAFNFLRRSKMDEEKYKFAFISLQPHQINALIEKVYSPLFGSEDRIDSSNYHSLLQFTNDPDSIGSMIYTDIINGDVDTLLSEFMVDVGDFLSKNMKLTRSETHFISRLKTELMQMFAITNLDYDIIILCICIQEMERTFCRIDNYPPHVLIADMLKNSYSDVRSALSSDSALIRTGIIEDKTRHSSLFSVSTLVSDYILGMRKTIIDETILETSDKEILPLENFIIENKSTTMMTDILKNDGPAHIFLYGKPGTGKTEISRTLSSLSGKKCYRTSLGLNSNDAFSGRQNERLTALIAAQSIAARNGAVLIVDEADNILNTRSFFNTQTTEKGWLNSFMDRTEAKIIWIANNISSIDPSTMRRFTYSLYFPDMSIPERAHVLRYQLEQSRLAGILSDESIELIATKYEVNAGGFTSAVKTAAACCSDIPQQSDELENILCEALEKHEILIRGEKRRNGKRILNQIASQYDPTVLNTDFPLDRIEQVVTMYGQSVRLLGESRGDGNVSMLFHGVPGTGKTEYAKYLAKQAGLHFIVKRASDLMNPFVGMTEKLIAAAFAEADRSGAILFIDEADSLFQSRDKASHTWETTQVNEILTQMENFRGILICCTNLVTQFDIAAMRRFSFKVEFKPLNPEMRIALYKKYFISVCGNLTDIDRKRLISLESLTPGDLRTVYRNATIVPDDNTTHAGIIDQLSKELILKKTVCEKKIGF